jgi:hypothetical protein
MQVSSLCPASVCIVGADARAQGGRPAVVSLTNTGKLARTKAVTRNERKHQATSSYLAEENDDGTVWGKPAGRRTACRLGVLSKSSKRVQRQRQRR